MSINNALNGYEKDDVNIKNAVYRVKNSDGTDKYSRIHFETSSAMIFDSTSEATGNMVARRDSSGSIKFNNIVASGKITSGSFENIGVALLNGATTIGGGLAANTTALTVASGKNTSLGGKLTVAGESTFTGKTTHSGGVDITNGLVVSGATALNGTLGVSGLTTLGSLKVNGDSALGGSSNTTTISGIAAINKITITDSAVVTNLNADKVDNCDVNDSASTATNLWTASKVNTTKVDKTIQITGTNGLTGGGDLSAHRQISHSTKTVTKSSASTSSFVAIQSMAFDSYGHPSSYVEVDMDDRYPTKSKVSEDIANAGIAVTRDLIAKNPQNRADNGNQLIMEKFSMQFNTTTQSIDFVFVA